MIYRKFSSIGFQFTVSAFNRFPSIKLPDKGMTVPEQPILNIQIDIISAIIGNKTYAEQNFINFKFFLSNFK